MIIGLDHPSTFQWAPSRLTKRLFLLTHSDFGEHVMAHQAWSFHTVVEDLCSKLTQLTPPPPVPAVLDIARRYRVPVPTAQFVHRVLTTRLRPPTASSLPVAPGQKDELWGRVAQDLKRRIHAGQLGERLPVQTELAAEYGVGEETLRKAVRALEEEGLVKVAGFRGTFVVMSASHEPGKPPAARQS
ncbi:winged helix-turn-helix domain-containing protein [Actinomycetota bacterium Odt1-20B]